MSYHTMQNFKAEIKIHFCNKRKHKKQSNGSLRSFQLKNKTMIVPSRTSIALFWRSVIVIAVFSGFNCLTTSSNLPILFTQKRDRDADIDKVVPSLSKRDRSYQSRALYFIMPTYCMFDIRLSPMLSANLILTFCFSLLMIFFFFDKLQTFNT